MTGLLMGKRVLLATLLSLMASAAAVNATDRARAEQIFMQKKDTCLLFAMNCDDNAYQVQQRIKRLRGEIMRGFAVYSDEELRILRKKLDEANKALEFVVREGA